MQKKRDSYAQHIECVQDFYYLGKSNETSSFSLKKYMHKKGLSFQDRSDTEMQKINVLCQQLWI